MDNQEYSIKELSVLSGASERALRYYEERGLLSPKRKANGYRVYGQHEVDTLQSILLYRACDIGLSEIAQIMSDSSHNTHDVLLGQLQTLLDQKSQVETLIENIQKTIASLEGKAKMSNEERFAGLKQKAIEENEQKYGKEARDRYGDAVIDASINKLSEMTELEWKNKDMLGEEIIKQLKLAMESGNASDAEKLCRLHERWLCMQWPEGTYTREAHLALAEGYVTDERFTAYYDEKAGVGATVFLRDALKEYCV